MGSNLTPDDLKRLTEMQDLMQKLREQIAPVRMDFQNSINNLPWGNIVTVMKFEGKNKQKFTVKALDEEFNINITRKVEVEED